MAISSNWIVCLGGNHNQIPYLREFKKLGFNILLFDKNKKAPGIELSNIFYQVGYEDNLNLLSSLQSSEIDLNQLNYIFSASSQFSQIGVSFLQEKLKIKGVSLKNIQICLNKRNFYKLFVNLSLPIPFTKFIVSSTSLKKIISNDPSSSNWYLKSDYGKSPNYIYKIKSHDINLNNINWVKDRYLRDGYLLQKEFYGEHLRVNIIDNTFCIFFHKNNNLVVDENIFDDFYRMNILTKLNMVIDELELKNFICKFDIILNKNNWVILDIGIDPPARLLKIYLDNNINFYNFFVRKFLGEKLIFPFTKKFY